MLLSVIFASYAIFGTELVPGTRPGGPEGVEAGLVSNLNEPFCLVCPMRPLCVLAENAVGAMKYSYVSQITYGPLWISGGYISSINLTILSHNHDFGNSLPSVLVPNLPLRRINRVV